MERNPNRQNRFKQQVKKHIQINPEAIHQNKALPTENKKRHSAELCLSRRKKIQGQGCKVIHLRIESPRPDIALERNPAKATADIAGRKTSPQHPLPISIARNRMITKRNGHQVDKKVEQGQDSGHGQVQKENLCYKS